MARTIIPVALLAVAAVGAVMLYDSGRPSADEPVHVRWLLAHAPESLYADSIGIFKDALERESNGSLMLDVVRPGDIGRPEGDVPYAEVKKLLGEGAVDLASTYTVANGSDDPAFWIPSLPFMFDNYDGLAALEGPAGDRILDSFSAKTPMHALAYALSGGFRIIASKKPLTSVNDLKGLRIATSGGPVGDATLRAFGAEPLSLAIEHGESFDPASVDAIETTYTRIATLIENDSPFYAYIAEMDHSMFMTSIVARDTFFDSLTPDQQAALTRAAREAARVEREASIKLAFETKDALARAGSRIILPSATERESLRAAAEPVYASFVSQIDQGIVEAVRDAQ